LLAVATNFWKNKTNDCNNNCRCQDNNGKGVQEEMIEMFNNILKHHRLAKVTRCRTVPACKDLQPEMISVFR